MLCKVLIYSLWWNRLHRKEMNSCLSTHSWSFPKHHELPGLLPRVRRCAFGSDPGGVHPGKWWWNSQQWWFNLEHIGDFFLSWGGSTETKWMSLTNLFLWNGVSMMTKPMDDLWSSRGREGPAPKYKLVQNWFIKTPSTEICIFIYIYISTREKEHPFPLIF